MISRKHRGLTRADTSALFTEGRRAVFPGGMFRWKQTNREASRVSVSIAKSAATNAATRSRLRRRVQAAISPVLNSLSGVDLLIVWTDPNEPDVHKLGGQFREMIGKLH